MNPKRLNLISNLYFYLIAFSGLIYTSFLVLATEKIVPAFVMQIIFLLDALKFDNSLIGLITSKLFLTNVVPGLVLVGLGIGYIKALIKSIKSIGYAKVISSNLEIIGVAKEFSKFKSKEATIFTLGFFNPKIYISTSIFNSHSQDEITAMIEHEINHRDNRHPLKIFIANFVRSVLPAIPKKDWLIDSYLTLVEVSSDRFSEDKIKTKIPLVSALLKFENKSFEPGMSYFNSQSERIKILVGQKKHIFKIPMVYYSMVLMVMLSGALFVKNTNIFYDCQHLLKCVELLINPDSQPLVSTMHPQSNAISTSDRCQ